MFEEQIKTGFVTIIGRPNAGKSTLLNNILKQKIAIMSDKPCLLYTSPSPRD